MATYGGTYTLTPTGLERKPTPAPKVNPRTTPTVMISGRELPRALQAYTGKAVRRRKTTAGTIKRKSSDTAIGSTRSWTGITEWAMIPATPQQRKEFDNERALKKIAALAKLKK